MFKKAYGWQEFENAEGGITCVEEYSRKEMLGRVDDLLDLLDTPNYIDDTVWIEYDDGSFFYLDAYYGVVEGSFKRQHIKGIIIDNGSTYEVYGKYRLTDGNMLVELV